MELIATKFWYVHILKKYAICPTNIYSTLARKIGHSLSQILNKKRMFREKNCLDHFARIKNVG